MWCVAEFGTQAASRREVVCGRRPAPVVQAEIAAREIGLSLEEALQLVLLYAAYEPAKVERAALRWFSRYLDEGKAVSLLKAQVALSALAELRNGEHEQAAKLLVELARR